MWVRQWSVYAETRSWKYDKEEGIYMDSKDLPANHFLITKEKDNNFTVEKPYNHLNQLSKISITQYLFHPMKQTINNICAWANQFDVSSWLGHRVPRYLVKHYSGCCLFG